MVRVVRWHLEGRSVDVEAVGPALRNAIRGGKGARLADALGPSWAGQIARAGIEADTLGADPGIAMAAEFRTIRVSVNENLRALRMAARASTFLALLAAIWEFARIQLGGLSLRTLVAGVAEAEAGEHASLSIAIGLGFAALALAARAMLRRPAQKTIRQCHKLRERLENLFENAAP
ncbi:MAG: hypothetical protein AAGE52_22555 [Myxococcota bacterium]